MRSAFARFVLGAVLLAPFHAGRAQAPRRVDSVSIDFATALAGFGAVSGPRDPDLFVGRLPDSVAARIPLPPSARVLGAVTTDVAVIAFVDVPAGDSALAELRRVWLQHGWRAPGTYEARALVPAPQWPDILRLPVIVCGDHQTLGATLQQVRGGVMTVSIRLGDPPRLNNRCAIRAEFATAPSPEPYVTVEPNAITATECGRMTDMGVLQRSLRTTAKPSDLLADFGQQLRDSGWTLVGDEQVRSQPWRRVDSTGALQEAAITVSQPPSAGVCRHLTVSWRPSAATRVLNSGSMAPLLTLPSGSGDYGPGQPNCMAAFIASRSLDIRSGATVSELVDQYGAQLAGAGWTRSNERTSVIGQTWTRSDSAGRRHEASVEVAASSSETSCRTVLIRGRVSRP